MLTDNEDPQEAAEILVQMANEGGGRDNITVVIVDVVEGLDPAEAEAPEEAVVGLEGFDPDKTAAITPIGDWVEDTLPPEPSEHDLPPPLPPPFHTDAELDDDDDAGDRELALSGSRASRILTWRTGAFTASLLTVVGIATLAVVWYARGTYYVGFDARDRVTLFKGQPGGVLWFQPTVVKHYDITRSDVPTGKLSVIEEGKPRGSEEDADAYVDSLKDEAGRLGTGTSSTTTTVTTAPTVAGATVTV